LSPWQTYVLQNQLGTEAAFILTLPLGAGRKPKWVRKHLVLTAYLLAEEPLASNSISLSLSFAVCKWDNSSCNIVYIIVMYYINYDTFLFVFLRQDLTL
jgi:hypothetical protein